jgi:hypothetical protein
VHSLGYNPSPYAEVQTTQEAAEESVVRQIVRQFIGPTVLLLASWASARAQLPPCYAGFEISQA